MFARLFKKKDLYDDYESEEDSSTGVFIEPQKLDIIDYIIAVLVGTFIAYFIYSHSYKGLYPTAWKDCAIASSLTPAQTVCPGLWRWLTSFVYESRGIEAGNQAIALWGKFSIGIVSAFVYLSFKQVIAILIRMIEPKFVWSQIFTRVVPIVATFLFAFSDPIWEMAQAFTPSALTFLLFVLALFCFLTFMTSGSLWPGYCSMFLIGILCAETPLGFFMLIAFWYVFYTLLCKGELLHVQLLEPLTRQSSKWLLTFFWGFGLVAGIAINVVGFKSFGGMETLGINYGSVPELYLSHMFDLLVNSGSIGGWIVGIGVAFLPFVLSLALLRRATDLEYFLSYHVGLVFFFVAAIAYTQLSSLPALWFWRFPSIVVKSSLLLSVCSLMAAIAMLSVLCVLVVGLFCRDHRRLALQLNPEIIAPEENPYVRGTFCYAISIFVMGALILGVLPARFDKTNEQILTLCDEYVAQVVDECDGVKFLFTDGEFDHRIELEAAARNNRIYCVPMVPKEGSRPLASLKNLLSDNNELSSLEVGSDRSIKGANLLLTMLENGRKDIAIQYWLDGIKQRSPRVNNNISGVVAYPHNKEQSYLAERIKSCHALSQKYLKFAHDNEVLPKYTSPMLVKYLYLSQFRLQCMAKFRYDSLKYKGEGFADAMKIERELLTSLTATNKSFKELEKAIENAEKHIIHQITPNDALMLYLMRADFSAGRRVAERVLETNKDDPRANFIMGMYSCEEGNYTEAEKYLRECVRFNKNEISYWNNLAMAQWKLGKYKEARESINSAEAILGNIIIKVTDTKRRIIEEEARVNSEAK